MRDLNIIDGAALLFLIVGGINWGSIALFQLDLVSYLFGALTVTTKIVYGVVAVSAIYMAYSGLMSLAITNQQVYTKTRVASL